MLEPLIRHFRELQDTVTLMKTEGQVLAVSTPPCYTQLFCLAFGCAKIFGFLLSFLLSASQNERPVMKWHTQWLKPLNNNKNKLIKKIPKCIWYIQQSLGAILPLGWNALHTLCERSRIITKSPLLTRSLLFRTGGHRDSYSITVLFHFAPVLQPGQSLTTVLYPKHSLPFHLLPLSHPDPTDTFY